MKRAELKALSKAHISTIQHTHIQTYTFSQMKKSKVNTAEEHSQHARKQKNKKKKRNNQVKKKNEEKQKGQNIPQSTVNERTVPV